MPESLSNKVAGLHRATSLKQRTSTQVFGDKFCDILKILYSQNTSSQLILFYGKKLINEIGKNPRRKEKQNGKSL